MPLATEAAIIVAARICTTYPKSPRYWRRALCTNEGRPDCNLHDVALELKRKKPSGRRSRHLKGYHSLSFCRSRAALLCHTNHAALGRQPEVHECKNPSNTVPCRRVPGAN